jgi:membrane protein
VYYSETALGERMKLVRKLLSRLAELVRVVARRFQEDHGLQTASSLTFTTLLSLVPIITVAMTLLSAFPVFHGMSSMIEDFIFDNIVPESAEMIEKYTEQFVDNAARLTAVGIAFLAVTSIMLLITIDDAFNDIWRVRRQRPMLQRVLIYWALITVGPLLIGGSLSLSSWLMSASAGWTKDIPYASVTLIKFSAIALTCIALALLYYAMPNRPVRVRDALTGGILAGVVFELTKHGFGFYITNFPTYKLVYGAFAAVPVFLMWLYISWLVVLLGAVVVAALPEWRQQSVQGRSAPGSNFVYALQVLKALWQAQQRGDVVTVPQLHANLHIRYERIETILEVMQNASWVNRALPSGWVLHRNPATIAVAEVYKLFVFDPELPVPAVEEQPELVTLARAFGNRIGDDAGMSVANLFEAGAPVGPAAVGRD